ncbi:MAG: Ig-like domain-containing protein, partial [Acidobacteriota bacterium]
PSVGYHVPQAGRTNYPVGAPISLLIHETIETFTLVNGESFLVRPLGGEPVPGSLIFAFDDILTFQPDEPLLADTTYEVLLPEGGVKDAAGNGMVGYGFTFSTGSSVSGNAPPEVISLRTSMHPARPAEPFDLIAVATDPEGDDLEYRFEPGDGSPRSAWSSASRFAHVHDEPGHYLATVQVRDPQGLLATGSVTVTVVEAVTEPLPTRSTPILCETTTRRVWAVNPDNDSLSALDADTLTLLIEEPTCDDPRSLALAGGEVWVACHDSDEIAVHGGDGRLLTRLALAYGDAPVGLAASPDGTTVHVTLQGAGELVSFAVATRSETGRVAIGPRPRALAVTGDGARSLVTRFLSAEHHAELFEVDVTAGAVTRALRVRKFGDDENRDTTASGKGVANLLAGVAIAPDGRHAWVAGNKPNSERGLLFGDELDDDNTVRNVVVQVDLETGDVRSVIDLDNSDSASAVGYSPLGDYLFVTLQGNDEVLVLDALRIDGSSGLGSLVTRLQAGAAPQGVCFDPVTNRTFVKNLLGRSLTVFETDPLFRLGDKTIDSVEVPTVTVEAMDPWVLLGKTVFYGASDPRMSAEGYVSCASCHLDGGHDGRTWDFTGRGEGLRNTTSLRGRSGTGHGNVHWSANFDEIQDFENDIRTAFGGSGFLSEEDWVLTSDPLGAPKAGLSNELDALAIYLESLTVESVPRSPHRETDGSMTTAARAGAEHFESLGCSSCHVGPRLTDSTLGAPTLHDVGTIRTTSGARIGEPLSGIDTPTLDGVWNTAPYFHDGSATTLEDVFVVAGGAVLQAEDAEPRDGAVVVDNFVFLNQDDTVHGRAFVQMNTGSRLLFTDVDGGAGGVGALELRYSAGWGAELDVLVNGLPVTSVVLPATDNLPRWRQTVWERLRLEDVMLLAGPSNVIELVVTVGTTGLDDLVVSTADDLAAAAPHRMALTLSLAERDELLAHVRELDGRAPDVVPTLGPVTLRVSSAELRWNVAAGATGYDLVRGDLPSLRLDRDLGAAALDCLLDDAPLTTAPLPAEAGWHWFLVRPVSAELVGSFGGGSEMVSRDASLAAAAASCP